MDDSRQVKAAQEAFMALYTKREAEVAAIMEKYEPLLREAEKAVAAARGLAPTIDRKED